MKRIMVSFIVLLAASIILVSGVPVSNKQPLLEQQDDLETAEFLGFLGEYALGLATAAGGGGGGGGGGYDGDYGGGRSYNGRGYGGGYGRYYSRRNGYY